MIYPLLITNATLFTFNFKKQTLFNCLGMYSNLFTNCQEFICTLLVTNATPIPVQYHKTRCILLLGNVFLTDF